MAVDPALAAALTLQRVRGSGSSRTDNAAAIHQLQLASVLLDGGYEGVTTLAEALASGDHGLGTVDRLDGELVVLDGEAWRVDWHGVATRVPLETRTPFVVVTTMVRPRTLRVRDASRAELAACVAKLADDPHAVLAVRLEGRFSSVVVRSVPPQTKPYRPYAEVCASDEVRWAHAPFNGVFVGFSFPELHTGSTIPGLHLHGLDDARTTGGHNHELQIEDALLSVSTSRDVVMYLPERSMLDMLEMPPEMRDIQRRLLRSGPSTPESISEALHLRTEIVLQRLRWLEERGFAAVEHDLDGCWQVTLSARSTRRGRSAGDDPALAEILEGL